MTIIKKPDFDAENIFGMFLSPHCVGGLSEKAEFQPLAKANYRLDPVRQVTPKQTLFMSSVNQHWPLLMFPLCLQVLQVLQVEVFGESRPNDRAFLHVSWSQWLQWYLRFAAASQTTRKVTIVLVK